MLRRAPAVEFTKHQIALQRTCVSGLARNRGQGFQQLDRKSTRLNSSHSQISYAVFCLKKKTRIAYRSVRRFPSNYSLFPPTPPSPPNNFLPAPPPLPHPAQSYLQPYTVTSSTATHTM